MVRVALHRAVPDDLPFFMATERLDGYDRVVGRWDEPRHRAALADRDHACFIGAVDDRPVGFTILRGWNSPDRVTLIKRIAVSEPGHGTGSALLSAIVETVFRETECHRLWLGVFPENARARRAYEKVGFVAEGVARGSAWFGEAYRDELTMAILRTDRQP
jgi:diamine N-acetyltransferase